MTQRTAARTDPVGHCWLRLKIGVAGAVHTLREDRILHQAQATGGDARRLNDPFGISATAAERYIAALDHPAMIQLGREAGSGAGHPNSAVPTDAGLTPPDA